MQLVLDTNIVLDLWVFQDATSCRLREDLRTDRLQWLATPPMREELERVLGYVQIERSLRHHQLSADSVLAQWDQQVQIQGVAAKATVTCKDPDDQKFIDLAVAHRCALLSKDRAVLTMKKRLAALGVAVSASYAPDAK